MEWKFFFGACLLTGAFLLPHAPAHSVFGGMALAGGVLFVWSMAVRHREP